MSTLDHFKHSFNRVGWFIPPYVSIGFLDQISLLVQQMGQLFSQNELEVLLGRIYSPEHLAAMVLGRYPKTQFILEYKATIAECVQAHFSGLSHIAVSGLMPVIEGAARKIALSRSLVVPKHKIREVFIRLAEDCKNESKAKNIGDGGQIASMMDSFSEYAEHHLYVDSEKYQLEDKTNRHGILHGAYSDSQFGRPINFYKAITAIDFLCFISGFRTPNSWFAEAPTESSGKLARFYKECGSASAKDPFAQMIGASK